MSPVTHSRSTDVESLAQQTGFSVPAVESMGRSMAHGGGRMAQFDHPEFGGAGQWMHGGLLMISDFSDTGLKDRIARLCEALAAADARDPDPASRAAGPYQRHSPDDEAAPAPEQSGGTWYPAALGTPDSSGAQNGMRYAWFGRACRLAVDDGGMVTVYDTGDHRIGGVSQQQGTGRSVAFVSQHGAVDVGRLPVVDGVDASAREALDERPKAGCATGQPESASTDIPTDPFVALERLAGLHGRGVIDHAEFTAKKAELLRRI